MEVRSYRDLKVWQKAIELVKKIYLVTKNFPKEQTYILTSQMQRAAISIASNIAEGRSRHSAQDFIYHLNIAKGSLAELETQIVIAKTLDFIDKKEEHDLLLITEEIIKMLYGLRDSLHNKSKTKTSNLKPVT